jgi:hypothetical protein
MHRGRDQKRQGTGAVQTLADLKSAFKLRGACWNAVDLYRFQGIHEGVAVQSQSN